MAGRIIPLKGFRIDKPGRVVRDQARLSVSLRLQQRSSKRVRVRRGLREVTPSSTAAKGLDADAKKGPKVGWPGALLPQAREIPVRPQIQSMRALRFRMGKSRPRAAGRRRRRPSSARKP
jgi:hypothetical protein